MVRAPGVVTGRYGTIGEVFFEDKDFWPLNTTLWVSDFHDNDEKFVYYLLTRVDFATHSGKSGVPGVNRNDLHTEVVALPTSKDEQRGISRVLQDCDDLVMVLERLIAKTQAIKHGMMQKLLSGKTRLPGFTGLWSRQPLGRLGAFFKGRGIKRDDVQMTGVPCIRYGELYTTYRGYTPNTVSFVSPRVASTALRIRGGDLLFAGSGETRDEIGTCVAYVGDHHAVAGGDIVVLRGTAFNPVFLSCATNTPSAADQKARLGQGDAVVHISSRALATVEVDMPPLDEQDAIAAVVMDADLELKVLNERLAKAKAIKQGILQELLTGRTRLPVKEPVA